MWKQFVSEYFIYTRKERRGIIAIVLLIIFLVVASYLFPYFQSDVAINPAEFRNEIAQLKIDSSAKKVYANSSQDGYYNDYTPYKKKEIRNVESFPFDPNTVSLDDWQRLGVKEKIAGNIRKYIDKGGKFYKPEDLKKIWGIPKKDVDRLIPFIVIKKMENKYPQYEKKDYPENSNHYTPRDIAMVDINTADTAALIALPGIGPGFAKRIISFRDKIGGFHSVEQVAETYLLPDSTFQKIKPYLIVGNTTVKKININAATIDEMKAHPYIRFQMANAIFQYRNQHGTFSDISQLKKIMIMTDEVFEKMKPYLSIE